MDKYDLDFVRSLSKNIDSHLFYDYIKLHKKKQTYIPDKLASYILDKSFELGDISLHEKLLSIISDNIIYNIYPGLFTFYFCNYSSAIEKCIIKLISRLVILPKDLQNKLEKFYRESKKFNEEIFLRLSDLMDCQNRDYFCEQLLEKCNILDIKYAKNEIISLVNLHVQNKPKRIISFDNILQINHYKSEYTAYSNLEKKEIQILNYYLDNEQLESNKNEILLLFVFCHDRKYVLQPKQIRQLLTKSFDFINLLSCEKSFIDFYIERFDENIEQIDKKNFDLSRLCVIYLVKHGVDIQDTNFYSRWLAESDYSKALDFCYDFLITNICESNDNINMSLLNIFYNLLQVNIHPRALKVFDNIFQCIYLQTKSDNIAKYLFLLDKIVKQNILPRKHLKYIYKQLVYYDYEDYKVRCCIYKMLGSIISDYANLDNRIETILKNNPISKIPKGSNYEIAERISQKDVEQYNKDNAKVLAALVWFDLKEQKEELEYPYFCELLSTIIKSTGNFYEKRVSKSDLVKKIIYDHKDMLLRNKSYNYKPFLQFLKTVASCFDVSSHCFELIHDVFADLGFQTITPTNLIVDSNRI